MFISLLANPKVVEVYLSCLQKPLRKEGDSPTGGRSRAERKEQMLPSRETWVGSQPWAETRAGRQFLHLPDLGLLSWEVAVWGTKPSA